MKKLFVSAAALIFACASLLAQNTDRDHILKIYNWSDYIDESLLEEFPAWYKEQTGEDVKVIYQTFDINEVMLAKIEKGHADFDLACPSDYIIERMLRAGLVLPINRNFGDTPDYTQNVAPFIRDAFGKLIAEEGVNPNDYAVGYMWGTTGFLYNTKYVTREEASTMGVIRNPKFKGQLFMKDAFRDVYGPVLLYAKQDELAAGKVTVDELMVDTSDESIALVEGILNEAKENIAGWEADYGKELMTQEKAWISLCWSGDAAWAQDEAAEVGVSLDYVVPVEGSNYWFDGWVIPKYAVNTKAASYFINYMCMPENAIRNMDECGYVSVIAGEEVLEAALEAAAEAGLENHVNATYFFGEAAADVILDELFYPDQSVIDRCTMMHDTGDDTAKLLNMWSRVKGDSSSVALYVLLGVVVCAGVVLAVRKKGSGKGRGRKKGGRK